MEPYKIAKQTIEFYKTTFDNTFNAMMMLQEQSQRMLKMQLDQTAGIPDEAKKAVSEWLKTYKAGCEKFKGAVDESFKRVETYFVEPAKAEKK
jgi:predicted enzyme related to lactoylglutathione lyase